VAFDAQLDGKNRGGGEPGADDVDAVGGGVLARMAGDVVDVLCGDQLGIGLVGHKGANGRRQRGQSLRGDSEDGELVGRSGLQASDVHE